MRVAAERIALTLLLTLLPLSAMAVDPSLQPAPEPRRAVPDVLRDWDANSEALRGVLPSPRAVLDMEKRKEIAPTATLLLRRALQLNNEMYHTQPDARAEARRNHYNLVAVLSFLGDAAATTELDEARQSNHKEIARFGQRGWFLAQWWLVGEDEARSNGLIDQLHQLAADSPESDDIATILLQYRQEGCASDAQDQRIQKILGEMRSPLAARATAGLKAAAKRESLLGKPLVLAGPTLANARFSTESLKGKYILLHFGATWCGPWQEQHNALLQMKRPDHVAIVTILCDAKPEDVRIYMERHKEIPWPVVYDSAGPVTFAAQFGVEDLPTSILIHPNGTVDATDVEPTEQLLTSLEVPATNPATRPAAK